MISKAFMVAALIAYVDARFGQEQVPISAISAVKGGAPGAAATVAGAAISDLLGGANSCAKLQRADQIVSELGGGADAIAAAIGMVTAEKNTNPFANNNTQNVCGDPNLPATAELRGITPLIDPAVDVNGAAAALSKSSAANLLPADGLSVFDLMNQAGLGDLIASQAAAGGATAGADAGNTSCNVGNADKNATDSANQNAGNANDSNQNAGDNNANQNQNTGNADQTANTGAGAATGGASTIAGADFGKCTPTIIFEGGANGRPANEFTFQIADPVARGGQQEALNPNIITNALCNQLTNVCGANAAAKAACEDGKAQVQAAGTRNKSTADLFNAAVGFAGAVTNPSGGPAEPAASAAAGNKRMRRGLRL
ncbi:hypothetical protein EJ07DRAFT_118752 [Lizonia empirigonia]|nr:hypothetical protein EJ07DRAFT_118752 [Lizonia empirigonia]